MAASPPAGAAPVLPGAAPGAGVAADTVMRDAHGALALWHLPASPEGAFPSSQSPDPEILPPSRGGRARGRGRGGAHRQWHAAEIKKAKNQAFAEEVVKAAYDVRRLEADEIVDLGDPELKPGSLKAAAFDHVEGRRGEDFTVRDALEIALPDKLMLILLEAVNNKREERTIQRLERHCARGKDWVPVFEAHEFDASTPRKHVPAAAPGVAQKPLKKTVKTGSIRNSARRAGVAPADDETDAGTFDNWVYTEPFSLEELRTFFAILLRSSQHKPPQFRDLFNTGKDAHGKDIPNAVIYSWVLELMSRDRALELYSCLQFADEDHFNHFQEQFNSNTERVYLPASSGAVDESMAASMQKKNNPHHVLVKRKRRPNGLKFWVAADWTGVILRIIMFQRKDAHGQKVAPEHVEETLIKMATAFPPRSLIVFDALFSSLKAVDDLGSLDYDFIASTRKDRPSGLWRPLSAGLQEGGSATATFRFMRPGDAVGDAASDRRHYDAIVARAKAAGRSSAASRLSGAAPVGSSQRQTRSAHRAAELQVAQQTEEAEAHVVRQATTAVAIAAARERLASQPPDSVQEERTVLSAKQQSELRRAAEAGRRRTGLGLAHTSNNKRTSINTLSSVGSNRMVETVVKRHRPDKDQEDAGQEIQVTEKELCAYMRILYKILMDAVDEADRVTDSANARFRANHWSTPAIVHILTHGAMNNARQFYRSGTGDPTPISPHQWNDMVFDAWTPAHIRSKVPGHLADCRTCRGSGAAKRHRTTHRCGKCGPVCKECWDDGTHHRVSVGRHDAKVRHVSAQVHRLRDRDAGSVQFGRHRARPVFDPPHE